MASICHPTVPSTSRTPGVRQNEGRCDRARVARVRCRLDHPGRRPRSAEAGADDEEEEGQEAGEEGEQEGLEEEVDEARPDRLIDALRRNAKRAPGRGRPG